MSASVPARSVGAGCLLLVTVLGGCATRNLAPAGWLPTPEAAPADAFGGWIAMTVRSPVPSPVPAERPDRTALPAERYLAGELIAVHEDTVFVLSGDRLDGVPIAAVLEAEVWDYEVDVTPLGTWGVLGTVSTLTHGWFLVFSVPVWTLTGSLITRSASRAPRTELERRDWPDARRFARFPQGLPAALDRAALRSRQFSRAGR